MGCVYALIFPNGKRYVGLTKHSAEKRWAEHQANARYGDKEAVYCAIRKHGAPKVEVLEEGSDYELLQLLEIDWIVALGSKTPGGYNLTDGGESLLGYRHTREQKRANQERWRKQWTAEFRARHAGSIQRSVNAAKPKVSTAAKLMWERPGFRESQSERWKKLWADPGFKASRLAKQRAGGFFSKRAVAPR